MKRHFPVFLLSSGLILLLYLLFNPAYHTNDDNQWIWMLEGIGANSKAPPTPYTVYQNFLIGYIYQLIPDFFDIFGYNWLHILTQIFFLSTSILLLNRSTNINPLITFGFSLTLTSVNFFLPQYSITPILLLSSAIVILKDSKSSFNRLSFLSIGLIIWASMIRIEPFIFSVIVLIPYIFLYLKNNFQKKILLIGISLSIILSGLNYHFTKNSLSSGFFYEDLEKKIILDYKGRDYFYKNPNDLKASGLTLNDAKFFGHWLLFDKEINNKILSKENILKINYKFGERFKWGVNSIIFLFKNKNLKYLTGLLILSLILSKNVAALLSFLIFSFAIFYSGYLGRDPLIRIYLGPLIVLTLFNLSCIKLKKHTVIYLIISFSLLIIFNLKPLAHKTLWKEDTARIRLSWVLNKVKKIETDIIWWPFSTNFADDFYRIKNLPNIRKLQFIRPNYNWGDASDPRGEKRQKKFKKDFTTIGISLIVDDINYFKRFLPIFENYCLEHFHGKLQEKYLTNKDKTISIATINCKI
jgi:hypothetical protein